MKIPSFDLTKISVELDNFKNAIIDAWNYGKYAEQIVTSVPTWKAQPGEQVLFYASSGGTTLYFYKNSAWVSAWSVTV